MPSETRGVFHILLWRLGVQETDCKPISGAASNATSSMYLQRWLIVLAFILVGCQRDAPAINVTAVEPVPVSAIFTGSSAGQERKVAGVKLCWCPPGQFQMGSPLDEPDRRADETQVEVILTEGFWMGK